MLSRSVASRAARFASLGTDVLVQSEHRRPVAPAAGGAALRHLPPRQGSGGHGHLGQSCLSDTTIPCQRSCRQPACCIAWSCAVTMAAGGRAKICCGRLQTAYCALQTTDCTLQPAHNGTSAGPCCRGPWRGVLTLQDDPGRDPCRPGAALKPLFPRKRSYDA